MGKEILKIVNAIADGDTGRRPEPKREARQTKMEFPKAFNPPDGALIPKLLYTNGNSQRSGREF
jgi:hypothetical protein